LRPEFCPAPPCRAGRWALGFLPVGAAPLAVLARGVPLAVLARCVPPDRRRGDGVVVRTGRSGAGGIGVPELANSRTV